MESNNTRKNFISPTIKSNESGNYNTATNHINTNKYRQTNINNNNHHHNNHHDISANAANEANKMLEAALQQMDGIILGVSSLGTSITTPTSVGTPNSKQMNSSAHSTVFQSSKNSIDNSSNMPNVILAAKKLSTILQQNGNMAQSPDPMTASILNTWLETHLPRQDTDERLRRLQNDKESLALQVQVLSEQVNAQNDKISDLERLITDKTHLISNTEDLLQREMLTRSSLETQKLEFMSAMSELKLQQASLERENLELRACQFNNNNNNNNTMTAERRPPVPGRVRTNSTSALHSSHNNIPSGTIPKTPPSTYRRQVDIQYNSLPRPTFPNSTSSMSSASPVMNNGAIRASSPNPNLNSSISSTDSNANPKQRNVAFGKDLTNNLQYLPYSASKSATNIYHHQLVLYQHPEPPSIIQSQPLSQCFQKQRGVSVPNLAGTEKIIDDINDFPQSQSPSMSQKSKSIGGLKSIFGKLRRSNSGNLEDLPLDGNEFRRGGVRATASARLGWNNPQVNEYSLAQQRNKPFSQWDVDAVCLWFQELGLGIYEDELRKWLKNGAIDLINASPIDIEKELNLKSLLHRKKIVLAVIDIAGKDNDDLFCNAGKLDMSWVLRWLDDIGLPQHKDIFTSARIDGRVLHRLTMDDLSTMHITSALHAASLRRGIQLMRECKWNPDCLIRRSIQTDDENGGDVAEQAKQVHLWTAHRVMEWLRVVDLAEYAPNLRGAGVHGALMMYEPRFTAELLADLLSIPPSKTLLRRHLGTHFKELLGRDVIQEKRAAETTLGYQPLSVTTKLKTPKKSQFTLKRKKSTKGGDEWSDYVCPMGPSDDEQQSPNRRRGCLSGE